MTVFECDLIAPEALRHPFELYRTIRDLGAAVRLASPDVYAIGRFVDVRDALRSPEILVSGQGVGFNDFANAPREQPSTITSDGERHRLLRSVLARPLMPSALKAQRAMLKDMIAARIESLLGQGEFDAVTSIAQYLPLNAVSFLVGLPSAARPLMLRWATAGFNATGPRIGGDDPQHDRDRQILMEARDYFQTVDPADLEPGSWAATLFDVVETGKLTLAEARAAISGLVLPSLDTTINAKSNLLYNLARNPEQWAMLRADPGLIQSAVLEGVRHSAVVRWFSRVAVEDYVRGEVSVPKGSRVMLLYGSANRDERHYPDPDRFDVSRNPVDQLGWGTGPHMCAGMHLARLEMEVMLEALVERVSEMGAGTATLGVNRGLYGLERFAMRIH